MGVFKYKEMAKLNVSIYWKGVYYVAGSEAPEGVPARFTGGEPKNKEKVVAKVSTGKKEKKIEEEDKNGAPKKRSTKKK